MNENVANKIRDIKDGIGNITRKALIVEGDYDLRAFEILLSKINQSWRTHWVVAEAGKKQAVLDILKEESDWLGIIDRDEWDEEKISSLAQANLLVLPRYCI
ncbi:DUF4435 domain-containing protein [Thioflexithrix psekupsensis]|uniref:DUF4435 domain-containing protein n=1 Tax=Thioflexithrix psekupsensis TaxID=1570016 RepID=UPI000A384AB9|nr:DUF4435 domain-containing protein [Thioflexithrix psekupsensis]